MPTLLGASIMCFNLGLGFMIRLIGWLALLLLCRIVIEMTPRPCVSKTDLIAAY